MIPPLAPMLAVASQPFDSDEHLFEIKWDGVRALASVEGKTCRLWGREKADYTSRYPELDVLCCWPSGTVLDGELVLLKEGLPDLPTILGRHGMTARNKIQCAARINPVTYVVFDLLYERGASLCGKPLHERRQALADLLARHEHPRLVLSPGLAGSGPECFELAVAQGHEGIMAKHLASHYLPGRRSAAWRKIKPAHCIPCVIIGYRPGREGFGSLLVAAEHEGALRYTAQLTQGFTRQLQARLGPLLARRVRARPVVDCPHRAVWVEAELYCRVRFLQWTESGRMRGACFAGLIQSEAA
jgi:bifunctional non-homologous end joining protein LigD